MGKPAKTYPEGIADHLGSKLDDLAQKPKGIKTEELVVRVRAKIEAAQASGYTLDDVVGVFKSEGVEITLNTLKKYLQESKALSSKPEMSQPDSASQSSEQKKTAPTSQPLEQEPGSVPSEVPKPKEESVPSEPPEKDTGTQLTNTDENGFQKMLPDNEL